VTFNPLKSESTGTQISYLSVCMQEEHGIQARRLPIAEHMAFLGMDPSCGSSPVLNVSDVAIALCTLWQEGSWEAALQLSVSQRKRKPQIVRPKRYRASNRDAQQDIDGGFPKEIAEGPVDSS